MTGETKATGLTYAAAGVDIDAGNALVDNLHAAASKLEALFTRTDALETPNGQLMTVEEFEMDVTDELIYCTTALRCGMARKEPAAAAMGDIEIHVATGNGKDE